MRIFPIKTQIVSILLQPSFEMTHIHSMIDTWFETVIYFQMLFVPWFTLLYERFKRVVYRSFIGHGLCVTGKSYQGTA